MKNELADVLVVLDIDGTLYPYAEGIAAAVRRQHGKKGFNLMYEEPNNYDLVKAWAGKGLNKKSWDLAHKQLVLEKDIHEHAPICGSPEAVFDLRNAGAEIQVQTKRNDYSKSVIADFSGAQEEAATEICNDWLGRHYEIRHHQIHQTSDPDKPKGIDALPSGYSYDDAVFVEDSVDEIKSLLRGRHKVVMHRCEQNKHLTNEIPHLRNFTNWADAPELIKAEAGRQ